MKRQTFTIIIILLVAIAIGFVIGIVKSHSGSGDRGHHDKPPKPTPPRPKPGSRDSPDPHSDKIVGQFKTKERAEFCRSNYFAPSGSDCYDECCDGNRSECKYGLGTCVGGKAVEIAVLTAGTNLDELCKAPDIGGKFKQIWMKKCA